MQVFGDLLAKRAAERRELMLADTVNIKGRKADPVDGGSDDEEEEDEAATGGLAASEGRRAERAAQADDGFSADLLPKKRKRDAEAGAEPEVRLHAQISSHGMLCTSFPRRGVTCAARAILALVNDFNFYTETRIRFRECVKYGWELH